MLRVSPTYGEAIRNLKRKRYQEALKREDYHAAALAQFDMVRKPHRKARGLGVTTAEYRKVFIEITMTLLGNY